MEQIQPAPQDDNNFTVGAGNYTESEIILLIIIFHTPQAFFSNHPACLFHLVFYLFSNA
jgi:hypothetical protein